LISIHSAEENKFAIDLADWDRSIGAGVWIGAKRNNSLNYFEWTDGQEINYSNWNNFEPKNLTGPESVVSMYPDGTWGAWPENLKALFICEKIHPMSKCLNKQIYFIKKFSNNSLRNKLKVLFLILMIQFI
jgi:hypothetical protein